MTQFYSTFWKCAFLICFTCLPACPQDVQFLPEADVYLKLNSTLRVYLQAKDDREGGEPTQLTIGPSIQLSLKPLIKLKDTTAFDLDDTKAKAFVLETGYRSITAPGAPPENRMETIATFHFPMKARFLISDMNRADLDWKNGGFTWRYENKLIVERTLSIRSYHPIPYIAAEPYYESQYNKWSTTALYAGAGSPWASTSFSTPTMNTKTTPARARISSKTSSDWPSTFIFL